MTWSAVHKNCNSTWFSLVISRSRSLLLKIRIQFPLNNFSLIWPIDAKVAVWVAYIKSQLGIATQVYVIKVKVTVTKNRNFVSAQ